MGLRNQPVLNGFRRHAIEAEAASKVEQMMRREFGLTPSGAIAKLCGSVLRVTLENAVSPMGRVIAQADGGSALMENVYGILHDVNRERMHGLVSRILGVSVRQSLIETDLLTSGVFVTFRLDGPPL